MDRNRKCPIAFSLKILTKRHVIPTVRHDIYAQGFVRILSKHNTYTSITAQSSQTQVCSSQTPQCEAVFVTHTSARVATVWNDTRSVSAVRQQTRKNVSSSLPDMRKSMPVDNYLAHPEISCNRNVDICTKNTCRQLHTV